MDRLTDPGGVVGALTVSEGLPEADPRLRSQLLRSPHQRPVSHHTTNVPARPLVTPRNPHEGRLRLSRGFDVGGIARRCVADRYLG